MNFTHKYILFFLFLPLVLSYSCKRKTITERPNFIIFLTDDQGYNDVACYGSPNIKTPHLDEMAKQGIKFTSFYAQPLCGPSRAALLTGSYPIRIAEPNNTKGLHTKLHTKEITIAEVLKTKDYKTACIGKWHAGEEPEQMPLKQGFDYYFGTDVPNFPPYCFMENDRTIGIPTIAKPDSIYGVPGVMLKDWDLVQILPGLEQKAVQYIHEKAKSDRPFFLYFPLTAPHTPIAPAKKY